MRGVQRRGAPKTYPCPHAGERGRRQQTHTRPVRASASGEVLSREGSVGEYRARGSGGKTFRSPSEGIEARAEYTHRVRDAVRDRLRDDRMRRQRLREARPRECHRDLAQGFRYDGLDGKVRPVARPAYRQGTWERFAGTLGSDAIHRGRRSLLVATDPLGDCPVAFARVRANDPEHRRRCLHHLRNGGCTPRVVVSEGSNWYPKLLAAVWPAARQQLGLFDVLRDSNACVRDGRRRRRRPLAAPGKPKRRRGRRSTAPKRARARAGATKKEPAYFIGKQRPRLVTRPEARTGHDRRTRSRRFASLLARRRLRDVVLQVEGLFDPDRTLRPAGGRWARLVTTPEFLAAPDLARALTMLEAEKFEKRLADLDSPAGQRVRTTNHVERVNRRRRYFEKGRSKWRRRRTMVRFLVLAIARWSRQHGQQRAKPKATCKVRKKPQTSTVDRPTKVAA